MCCSVCGGVIMTAHHLLSPSSGVRWFACPGSAQAEASYPREENAYAQEGSEIHDLAAHCLETDKQASDVTDDATRQEVIQTYLDYVRMHGDFRTTMIEVQVDLSSISPGMFGTADAVVLDTSRRTIHVIDLKAGQNKVDAYYNVQLSLYAAGALDQFRFLADWERAVLHICQPRIDYIGSFELSVDDLDTFAAYARDRAEAALAEDAPRTPSDSACRWCKHAGECNELRIKTYREVCEMFEDPEPVEPDDVSEYSANTLAEKLAAVPLIKSWLTAVEARAYKTLEDGYVVPGWKLVEGRKLRRWKDAAHTEAVLRKQKYKVKDIFKSTLISPAQAEKLVGKGNPLLDDLVETPTGKPTLAPSHDKRPDIRQQAADQFDSLTDLKEAL